MGVDISGKNPIVRGVKPTIDWDTANEAEKDLYWEAKNKWHKENPGDYYQDSWWGWRPMAALIAIVNEEKDLGIDISYFGSNDGAGPDDQETCDALADGLAEKLTQLIMENPDLSEDDDRIYLMMGSWVNMDSQFIHSEIADKLSEGFEYGQMMTKGIVMEDGTIAYSAHSTSLGRIKRFISFLRECGGFEIW
jgi:hypothetical protein